MVGFFSINARMGCHLTITIKVLDLSTLHWQPVGNLTSARLHLKLNLLGMNQ